MRSRRRSVTSSPYRGAGGPSGLTYPRRIPATRRSIDRDTKQADLLDVAEELFLTHGYEAAGMAQLARAAGVAPNTIYWYFPSKDHLFAATLERWVGKALQVVERRARDGDPVQVARVVVTLVRELQPLLASIHERAAHVDVVRELHDRLHRGLETTLAEVLRHSYARREDAAMAAGLLVAVVEGAYAHPWAEPPSPAMVDAAVRALAAGDLPLRGA